MSLSSNNQVVPSIYLNTYLCKWISDSKSTPEIIVEFFTVLEKVIKSGKFNDLICPRLTSIDL